MAEGKNIAIKIAATGGDQAAAEVRKVEQAAKELTTNTPPASTGFGGMLDKLPEQAAKAEKKVEDLDQVVEDLVKNMEKVSEETKEIGKQADEANPKLDKIANIQRAQVAAQIAAGLGKVGESVREAAEKFKAADPEFSKTLGNAAVGLETMASAAGLAAQGFAVGGPLGGAIGALVGTMLPALKTAMDDAIKSMEAAVVAQAGAEQSVKMLAAAHNMGITAYQNALDASQSYQQATNDLTKSLDAQTAAMEKRNRVRDSKDSADAAERDNADAAEIRGGAPREDVEARRAAYDAQVAKDKVARDLEAKRLAQVKAADLALQAGRETEAVTNDPTLQTKEQREAKIKEKKEAQAAAEKAFLDAQNDFEIARDQAPQQNRQIDARSAGRVSTAEANKADRIQKEAEKKAADDKSEADAAARKAEAEKRRTERAGSKDDGEAGKAGRDAVALLPDGTRKEFADAVKSVSRRLQNGDQGGELKELAALMKDLAGANVAKNASVQSEISDLRKTLGILQQQIKNK
jgi:hypothetical protein